MNNYTVTVKFCEDDIEDREIPYCVDLIFFQEGEEATNWNFGLDSITKSQINSFIKVLESRNGQASLLENVHICNGSIHIVVKDKNVSFVTNSEYGSHSSRVITNDSLIEAFKSIATYYK